MLRLNMLRHKLLVKINRVFGKVMKFRRHEVRAVERHIRVKEIYISLPIERYRKC